MRWFKFLCERSNLEPTKHYHELVLHYFPSGLPGPFAEDARKSAGMSEDFFGPVSRESVAGRASCKS